MGQYKSQYTGPQIDAGINAALNPDVAVTPDSDALVTSGAVADAMDNIDPTITSDTDTTLNGILVGNGSKVGTKSLDTSSLTNDNDHMPTSGVVKSAITKVETDLASIHAVGPTNGTGAAITAGTYFYLTPQIGDDEILVRANAGIASGATFTLDTNYKIVTAGALNYLNMQMFAYGNSTGAQQTFDLSELLPSSGQGQGPGPALLLSSGHHNGAFAAIVFLNSTTENYVSYISLGSVGDLSVSSISFTPSTKTLTVNYNSNPNRKATVMALTQLKSW